MKFAQMLSRGCRGLILAVLAFGAAGLGVAARAQESPPSFVDERRLPQSGPDAARQRQSQEALDKLKGEYPNLAARAAILAPSALGFGMARMFDSLASLAQWPGEVRVFRSGEGLAEWLFGDEDCRMAGELATAVAGEAPVTLR